VVVVVVVAAVVVVVVRFQLKSTAVGLSKFGKEKGGKTKT